MQDETQLAGAMRHGRIVHPCLTASFLLLFPAFDCRVKPRELKRIAGEFGARGAAFLADLSSRDDRSLIMVERKAA